MKLYCLTVQHTTKVQETITSSQQYDLYTQLMYTCILKHIDVYLNIGHHTYCSVESRGGTKGDRSQIVVNVEKNWVRQLPITTE